RCQVPGDLLALFVLGCEAPAVRAEADAGDKARVPLESNEILSAGRVVHLHRMVRAARGEARAVRTEAHAVHPVRVALESEQFQAAGRVPYLHRLIPAGRGEAPAVRT